MPINGLRLVTGARGDIFNYDVSQRVNTTGGDLNGNVTRSRPNVKANLILGPWYDTELFANFGTGFHSNDARAVILNPALEALPTAQGYEFGAKIRVTPRVELSATYWALDLHSELVVSGDAGTTEPAGSTHRAGWEFGTRIGLLDWLTLSGYATVTTKAEFDGTHKAVPLAPRLTSLADLTARLPWGLSASLEMRQLGDRFADEDEQQTARGYTLFNLTARYRYKMLEAFMSLENLLDTEYREAQFFFTSRLPGEPAGGVPDIHFTPGTPRSVLGGLALRF